MSDVLDATTEFQPQGREHASYIRRVGRGCRLDGAAEAFGDLHGVVEGTRREVDQDHTENILYTEDLLGCGGGWFYAVDSLWGRFVGGPL